MNGDAEFDVPVLVVGAGPAGLMTCFLLTRYGVRSLLVERHAEVSVLPRANWVSDAVYLRNNLERGVVTYTMHPQVIGRGHRMVMLEALIGSLRDLVFRFQTMKEALAEWR